MAVLHQIPVDRFEPAVVNFGAFIAQVPQVDLKHFAAHRTAHPNLTDVCDLCGGPSRTGHLCAKCSDRLRKDIDKMLAEEQAERERKREHSYKMKGQAED